MVRSPRVGLLLIIGLLLVTALVPPGRARAQIDRDVRDRVVPAAVEIAVPTRWREDEFEIILPLPIGSGTIVSPNGLILTNDHVVDPAELDALIAEWNQEIATEMPGVEVDRASEEFVILVSDGLHLPEERYHARVIAEDPQIDLAVLRVTADASGSAGAIAGTVFPFVPLGDSDALGLGDRIHVFSYPAIGGDTLTYTVGAISGFLREDGIDGVAWITTDAVLSGGSSGGTAINDAGELVGIPTQGSELDCRPGDTNRDGVVDVNDIGCIPTGGSLGRLRPSNLAIRLLQEAVAPTPTTTPASTPSPTPRARRLVGAERTPTATPAPPVVTPAPGATGLDLPRLALNPADLADLGFAGYALDWGQLADAAGAPAMLGLDASWDPEFAALGLREVYALRNVAAAPGDGPADYVSTLIWEYEDAAAATDGFDLIERRIEATLVSSDAASDFSAADEAELTTWTFTESVTGQPMASAELTFRLQNLVGAARVAGPASERDRLIGDAETLAAALAARLDRARGEGQGAAPGLSRRIVRLVDDRAGGTADYYLMEEGAALPLYWHRGDEATRFWTDYWQQLGIEEAYETEILLPTDPTLSGPRTRVDVQLFAFNDDQRAKAFVELFDADLEALGATSIVEARGAPAYGEASRTFTFETDWWTDVNPEFRVATVIRTGSMAAVVEVAAVAPVPMAVIEEIAAAQEACLDRGCDALTMPVPAWLLAQHAAVTPAATATPSPSPTPSPTPLPLPTATPTAAALRWGIDESFDDPGIAPEGTDVSEITVNDGRLTLAITAPGGLDGFIFDGMPTEGRDFAFTVDVVSTSGWGEINLRLGTVDDETEWFFAIDPVTSEWSLYRTSIYTDELFYWVEPRGFARLAPGPIEHLEVRVISGRPTLLINGVDVVAPTGIAMPAMDGSLAVGFGAGINPYSLSGSGETFSVVFERVRLVELGT